MTDLLTPAGAPARGPAGARPASTGPAHPGGRDTHARNGALMALVAMTSVQLGLAVSVGLVDVLGVAGAAWLRLSIAALVLLVVVRPRRAHFTRDALGTTLALGVATGGITLLFMSAIERLPLGTASALEFLGPLGVAVVRGRGAARVFPLLALVGVLLLTEPWSGGVDLLGVAFALGAAVCWAAYIVLTQRAGDAVAGLSALSVSLVVAALVATVATLATEPSALTALSPTVLAVGVGAAVLLPLVPYVLELLALRRLTTASFGTLMALEPAIALVVGLVALSQVPSLFAVLGIGFVVAAGIGAERTGARSCPHTT